MRETKILPYNIRSYNNNENKKSSAYKINKCIVFIKNNNVSEKKGTLL